MTQEFGVYDPATAKEIKRRVMGDSRSTKLGYDSESGPLQSEYYGVLTENLAAATNPYAGWTKANVRILMYSDYSARNMTPATGDEALIEAINRSTSLSASSGKFVIIKQIMNEWAFIWVDC